MNKKQYQTFLIVYAVASAALIITNFIFSYIQNWIWVFVIISIGYFYLRYKLTSPLQSFANRFNMMVDYDLDVEGALEMVKRQSENAPTKSIESMFNLYLGMAYYYNGKYEEAIKTFNQIPLKKVNSVYHILIFAFTAYSAFELGDEETFNIALERIENAKDHVGRKFVGFAHGYVEILNAMKNIETDPEHFREIIEKNFSREDGYVSTKLVYNYRMAQYYQQVGNIEEMDKCLAVCIANGKNHHTAIQAKKMFQNTCNVEDFVFPDPSEMQAPDDEMDIDDVQKVGMIDDPLQIDEVKTLEQVDIVEEDEEEPEEETKE